jgi:hypothetical protein
VFTAGGHGQCGLVLSAGRALRLCRGHRRSRTFTHPSYLTNNNVMTAGSLKGDSVTAVVAVPAGASCASILSDPKSAPSDAMVELTAQPTGPPTP